MIALALIAGLAAGATADKEGCTDHPLLPSRIPGYVIESCDRNDFSAHVFPTTNGEKTIEGKSTSLRYGLGDGKKASSETFIRKNYEQALAKVGGKTVNPFPLAVQIKKAGVEAWVSVSGYTGDGTPEEMGAYYVTIVEQGKMEQVVQAADIFGEIERTGRVALYIQFDTGKATIQAASEPLLAQMGKMLAANARLNVYVVGHTDMQGALDPNLKLSADRAESVVKALTTKHGVAAKRLVAKGVGPLSPIATNANEAGRQLNRRVELVAQ